MTTSEPKISCLTIIGPDNNPLLLQKYCNEKQDLEIETLLFCSLDYIDQKKDKDSFFLGKLQTTDRFQIWGYKTNLKYKIVILTSHSSKLKEEEIENIFEKIKLVLFGCFMDPFYIPFSVIKSPKVIEKIENIILTI